MTLMVAGEVVALRTPRLWFTLPLLVVFLEGLARPWEGRQLLETYGERYVRYHESVPRWLPHRVGGLIASLGAQNNSGHKQWTSCR